MFTDGCRLFRDDVILSFFRRRIEDEGWFSFLILLKQDAVNGRIDLAVLRGLYGDKGGKLLSSEISDCSRKFDLLNPFSRKSSFLDWGDKKCLLVERDLLRYGQFAARPGKACEGCFTLSALSENETLGRKLVFRLRDDFRCLDFCILSRLCKGFLQNLRDRLICGNLFWHAFFALRRNRVRGELRGCKCFWDRRKSQCKSQYKR